MCSLRDVIHIPDRTRATHAGRTVLILIISIKSRCDYKRVYVKDKELRQINQTPLPMSLPTVYR
jgi:hypothetical protein